MSRLPLIDPAAATGVTKTLLDAVAKKLGLVPNMMRGLANSSAALQGYLDLAAALEGAALSPKLREMIALTVAEVNGCTYCLSAHTALGGALGLPEPAAKAARTARAEDPRSQAVLRFARTLVLQRGQVTGADLRDLRAAGVSDREVAEIVVTVALNVLTNWFNHVADTPVDFPVVQPIAA